MSSKNELLRLTDWVKPEPNCRRYSVEYIGKSPYYQQSLYVVKIWSMYEDGELRPQMSKKGIGKTVKQAVDNCFDRGVPFDGNIAHSWESYHEPKEDIKIEIGIDL